MANVNDQFAEERAMVRRYEYEYEDDADGHEDARTVIAADFGPGATVSVDVVDGTAIIVAGDDQTEIDVPDGTVEVFNRNGVVTIEVV